MQRATVDFATFFDGLVEVLHPFLQFQEPSHDVTTTVPAAPANDP